LIVVMLGLCWVGLCLGWAAWVLRPASRSAVLPPWRRRAVPWTGLAVLLAVFITLAWSDTLRVLLRQVGFFAWLYGPDYQAAFVAGELRGTDASRVTLWVSVFTLPLNLVSVTALFYAMSGTRPYQLGLTTSRLGKNLLLGVLTAVCVVPVVYLVLTGDNWLLRLVTGGEPEEHPITRLMLGHPLPIDLAIGGLAAIVAAPFAEEFLFRGVIQPWFRARGWGGYVGLAVALVLAVYVRWPGLRAAWRESDWQGRWPELLPAAFVLAMAPGYLLLRAKAPPAAGAVYATSLLFAVVHGFALSHVVPLFCFALVLGTLRYRTQSLVPSVVTHGLFNAVAWAVLLLPQPAANPEKGKDDTSARARAEPVSTSSAVPGSVLPRRT
jgi:membrane protease YdiL (CAAX protease family)